MRDVEDDWLEGGAADDAPAESAGGKGLVVNKSKLGEITGLALATIDRAVSDGAPIISKGTRKQGWKLNSAAFFDWYWRRKVEDATGDPEAASFNAVKRREKEAHARLRELEIARQERSVIPVEGVVKFLQRKFGILRSLALAVPSQIHGLSPEQRDQLNDAIHHMLTEISGDKTEDWNEDGDADSEAVDEAAN